jgi:hypothetical protein
MSFVFQSKIVDKAGQLKSLLSTHHKLMSHIRSILNTMAKVLLSYAFTLLTPKTDTKTHWKSLSVCQIDHHQWTTLAADRQAWRHSVSKSVASFKAVRLEMLKEKRERR